MGIILAIVGALAAIAAFAAGIGIEPVSAPQQMVQELRFAEALLGLIVLSLGLVLYRLDHPRRVALEAPPDPRLIFLRAQKCRVDGLDFNTDGSPVFYESNTAGPWSQAECDAVRAALKRHAEAASAAS